MNVFLLLVLVVPILFIVAAIVNSVLRPATDERPRGFPWVLLLFGVIAAGGVLLTLSLARSQQRLVVAVNGPPGVEFIVNAEIDGRPQAVQTLVAPCELEFEARSFGVVVLAKESDADRPLEVVFGGDFSGIALNDPYGVRFGAFQRLLTGSAACTPISEAEWRDWMRKLGQQIDDESPRSPGTAAPSNPDERNEKPPDATSASDGM